MSRSFTLLLAFLLLLLPAGLASAATHTVSRGESLSTISKYYGTTVSNLKSMNGLRGDLIRVGQKLNVPDPTVRYTVRSGDSLYRIGLKFGVSANAIRQASGLKSTAIRPGQVLVIPSPSRSYAPTSRRYAATKADIDLLARLITAEADDQPYTVKVAVGAVVLNRVASSKFPNTIRGVIYDWSYGKVQFEPVLNGWINRPASKEARKAAEDALNGWDPSKGSLYFFEPWVKNRFLHGLPLKLAMGAFHFC